MMNNDIPDTDIDCYECGLIFLSVPPDPQGPDIDAQSCSLVYQASVLRKNLPQSIEVYFERQALSGVRNHCAQHQHLSFSLSPMSQCHTSCSKQLNHHHQRNSGEDTNKRNNYLMTERLETSLLQYVYLWRPSTIHKPYKQ